MLALRADLLDFDAAPDWGEPTLHGVRWRPDHWLLIGNDGRIAGVQPGHQPPPADWPREEHPGRLLMPGFIDSHVHAPQLDVIASFGTELLDWLNRYTFPAETAWRDPERARAGCERFLDALLAHGTTTAVVFPTVHKVSAEALFQAASARRMALIAGKVLMDRHAPDDLRDDADDVSLARADCEDLIARWHGHERCRYAVTVRFAATSTPEQLAMAGALCRADASLYMQTHVAENRAEVRWIAELFPSARSYLDVYASHHLLHRRAVLAHGIWLDDEDHRVLRDSAAQIAFCPSSNLFLGSGLLDWPRLRQAGVAVSLASDVGGGTSLCQLRSMADGYKVQALAGHKLNAFSALHAATRGAAQALALDHEIGSLEPGLMADLVLWDWARGPVARHRDDVACGRADVVGEGRGAQDLHARVFAWMTLADERNVVASYVAGRRRFARSDLS